VYVYGTATDRTDVYGDVDVHVYVDGTDEQINQPRTLPFVHTTAERCIKHPKRREENDHWGIEWS